MNVLTLDAETFWDKDFTLSKLTNEEYVRDPRFKVHGWAVKAGDRPAHWLHPDSDEWRQILKIIPHCGVVMHHAQFDGFILNEVYGVQPKFYFDTLSMDRLLNPHGKHDLGTISVREGLSEKQHHVLDSTKGFETLDPDHWDRLGGYAKRDVDNTWEIFKRLAARFPKEEFHVVDLTIRMFTEPSLRIDRERMEIALRDDLARREKALDDAAVDIKALRSADKFAALLKAEGIDPPMKDNPRVPGRKLYAFAKTDDGFKELLNHGDDKVRLLAEARLLGKSTINASRMQRLLDTDTRGPVPMYLNYAGAHTQRWSGGDKANPQNYTRGSELRKSILAPEGHRLVIGDLAQIECRMLNYLAGETDVLDAFRTGRDLYSEGASKFYGRTISKADKLERHLGKTIELGCGYGMGWEKFQRTCRQGALGGPSIVLTDLEARDAVKLYRDTHPGVVALWKRFDVLLGQLATRSTMEYQCEGLSGLSIQQGRLIHPSGIYLDYSGLRREAEVKTYQGVSRETTGWVIDTGRGISRLYGAKLVENVVQWLSRIVISEILIKVQKRYKCVLTVHDEGVWVVPENEAEEARLWIQEIMEMEPAWAPGIPLAAEVHHSERYDK